MLVLLTILDLSRICFHWDPLILSIILNLRFVIGEVRDQGEVRDERNQVTSLKALERPCSIAVSFIQENSIQLQAVDQYRWGTFNSSLCWAVLWPLGQVQPMSVAASMQQSVKVCSCAISRALQI